MIVFCRISDISYNIVQRTDCHKLTLQFKSLTVVKMVVVKNGSTVDFDIVEYMENSLNSGSNRSLTEMVLLSFGMSLYTILGVLGELELNSGPR